jgi:dipeptidyl aminopeptidase/acylaminoacyl peptidase
MQYTEVVSRSAYRSRYHPFYGALDSVVWAIPAKGTPRKWVDDGLDKVRLKASPDGTMVAYIVNGKNGEYNSLWMAGADGSNPQRLTPDYPEDELTRYIDLTGWSADGKKIAYRVDYYKGYSTGWLYIVDVPSKQVTEMDVKAVKAATWLPKSSHLLLISDGDRNYSIFDVNTQEVGPQKFRPLRLFQGFLSDGSRSYELAAGVLTVYKPDGSVLYQVGLGYDPPSYSDFTWSPDGKWFVFMDIDLEEKPLCNIYKLSQDNPTPQLVLKGSWVSPTRHQRLERGFSNIELVPTWSPDGQWFVVFNSLGKTGAGELYAVNVETNEIRTVMTISPFRPDYDGIGSVVWLK